MRFRTLEPVVLTGERSGYSAQPLVRHYQTTKSAKLRVNGPAGLQLRLQLGSQWLRLRHEPPVVFNKPALDEETRLHSCDARAKLRPEFWSLTHLRLILWHYALQLRRGAPLAPRLDGLLATVRRAESSACIK